MQAVLANRATQLTATALKATTRLNARRARKQVTQASWPLAFEILGFSNPLICIPHQCMLFRSISLISLADQNIVVARLHFHLYYKSESLIPLTIRLLHGIRARWSGSTGADFVLSQPLSLGCSTSR